MAVTKHQSKDLHEKCSECERETPHSVSLEILTESDKPENAQFSREPYRVSTCRICGVETKLRMNNA
jgi:hypothetical protein